MKSRLAPFGRSVLSWSLMLVVILLSDTAFSQSVPGALPANVPGSQILDEIFSSLDDGTGPQAGILSDLTNASASVTRAWVRRYNGKLNFTDVASALAVDSLGNIYVTGSSSTINLLDIVTIKYSPAGAVLWTRVYDGGVGGNDVPTAIAVDSKNNVIVTGISGGLGTLSDFVTIKYSSSGGNTTKPLWVKRYDGPPHANDAAVAVAVDSLDNVYVTGSSDPTGVSMFDYLTIKYRASDGYKVWENRYNGPTNKVDVPMAMTLDKNGYVYVTGQTTGNLTTKIDIATIKIKPDGKMAWTAAAVFDGPSHVFDVGRAVGVDASGNVYVTGEATSSTSQDYVLIKYNSAGTKQWAKFYDGPARRADFAKDLALDSKGNIYVTGCSSDANSVCDYLTIKYNPAGTSLWTARYNGPASGDDTALKIRVDASGNPYVTGRSVGTTTVQDFATIKYNTVDGKALWTPQRYNGPANDADVPFGLALFKDGSVYVAGYSVGTGTEEDYVLVKYTQTP